MIEIHEWEKIQYLFWDATLILGNGASIAIDPRFSYSSLIEHAKNNNFLDNDINDLFNFLDTNDFELVLRLVWQAAKVNKSFGIEENKTYKAYINLRNALIKTVQSIHPSYEKVQPHLPDIHNFIRNFSHIFTLNYDLILYWAIMYGNENDDLYVFKDCFIDGEFRGDWRFLRADYYGRKSRLVFYPHGSLLLGRNIVEKEHKISTYGMSRLLDRILDTWESEDVIPLFVSEGTSRQKVNAIKHSNYLNTIYREALGGVRGRIVIYGWGLGDQDLHILNSLKRYAFGRFMFAVSVYGNDQAFCNRIEELLKREFHKCDVYFFNSNSSGCWNNASSEKIVN